jgi:hypothetical protein
MGPLAKEGISDCRTDLWSAGVTIRQLPNFPVGPFLKELEGKYSEHFAKIVNKALSKEENGGFATAKEFIGAIGKAMQYILLSVPWWDEQYAASSVLQEIVDADRVRDLPLFYSALITAAGMC